jgi:hypothetical protein
MLSPAEDLDSDADARNFTQDSLSRNWAVAGDMIPCMHWWQIPLFIAVATWALISTPRRALGYSSICQRSASG